MLFTKQSLNCTAEWMGLAQEWRFCSVIVQTRISRDLNHGIIYAWIQLYSTSLKYFRTVKDTVYVSGQFQYSASLKSCDWIMPGNWKKRPDHREISVWLLKNSPSLERETLVGHVRIANEFVSQSGYVTSETAEIWASVIPIRLLTCWFWCCQLML